MAVIIIWLESFAGVIFCADAGDKVPIPGKKASGFYVQANVFIFGGYFWWGPGFICQFRSPR